MKRLPDSLGDLPDEESVHDDERGERGEEHAGDQKPGPFTQSKRP